MLEENGYSMKLEGESLLIAQQIKEKWDEVQADYRDAANRIALYTTALRDQLDVKHGDAVNLLLEKLAKSVAIPVEELRRCHLETAYLNHGHAFLWHTPVMKSDTALPMDGFHNQ